ncbi:Hsp20/alpha crystallin family protein [Halosegnis marinus]|uniref:Hsp20/alpha crystallin family protein n=1 Tax=Halosegnis marinus TaxID=3034023 RepID=A0ABD5ZR49_9EURY|nr:Hsp20 family protein [Halosegnis sp. DT85]
MTDLREIGESVGRRMLEGAGRVSARVQEERPLAADVLEGDGAYLVVFDAPGVEMEDVQVRFEDGAVHVRLDRFRDVHDGYEMVFPGRGLTLEGRADLPAGAAVEPTRAEATLTENGALRVEVPKVVAESDGDDEDAPESIDVGDDGDDADADDEE